MATVTTVLARIADPDGSNARIEIDYDDVPLGADEDHALIAVRCVNGLTRPVAVLIRRGNGAAWFTISVPAGQTRSQNAGGPVQRTSHIPVFELRA